MLLTYYQAMAQVLLIMRYSEALAEKPRWLVFNKIDLLLDEEVEEVANQVIEAIDWQGPVYYISAFAKLHTNELCLDVLTALDEMPREAEQTQQQEVEFKWDNYHEQAMADYDDDDFDDDDFDDDDYDVEVVYQR